MAPIHESMMMDGWIEEKSQNKTIDLERHSYVNGIFTTNSEYPDAA